MLGSENDVEVARVRLPATSTTSAMQRACQVGVNAPFAGVEHVLLPWLDEQARCAQTYSFTTRVTEHQTGGALNWD